MEIEVRQVPARPTAVVATVTTWAQLPSLWPELSGEVWSCLNAADIRSGHPNVMLFLDDRPSVEIGVLAAESVPLTGRVVASALPAGRVATVLHRGGYDRLGEVHEALHAWCRRHGELPTRTRWEVYGPHHDDPALRWTQVSWLLEQREGRAGGAPRP